MSRKKASSSFFWLIIILAFFALAVGVFTAFHDTALKPIPTPTPVVTPKTSPSRRYTI